ELTVRRGAAEATFAGTRVSANVVWRNLVHPAGEGRHGGSTVNLDRPGRRRLAINSGLQGSGGRNFRRRAVGSVGDVATRALPADRHVHLVPCLLGVAVVIVLQGLLV